MLAAHNFKSSDPAPNVLDLALAFLAVYGARPNEALKLIEGKGTYNPISSETEMSAKARKTLEEYKSPAGWSFQLLAAETKSKTPYEWVIPALPPATGSLAGR